MKKGIKIVLFLFWSALSFGQPVQRLPNETAEQFAERLKPDSSALTYKVLETKWNAIPVIIAFYEQAYKLPIQNDPGQQNYHKIDGAVFIQSGNNKYSKTIFGTIDTEGGNPVIEAVFFANADTDTTKELIVIASWEQRHYDVNGTLYGTFVFDYDLTKAGSAWNLLEEISDKLDGGCECAWRDGTSKKVKFKTASAIKKELTRLGLKQ